MCFTKDYKHKYKKKYSTPCEKVLIHYLDKK